MGNERGDEICNLRIRKRQIKSQIYENEISLPVFQFSINFLLHS